MSESVQIQGFDYPIVSKSINDIISEINFDSEEDKILCKDIVQFVEGNAAAYLLTDRAVLVPFIGTFERMQIMEENKEINAKIFNIKQEQGEQAAREYRTKLYFDFVNERNIKKEQESKFDNIKTRNIKYYSKYAKMYGVETAREIIFAFCRLTPINFDEEIEEQLQIINNESTT